MLPRLLAGAVGAVLALAGASKITDWSGWMRAARQQGLWSWVARVVPPMELLAGASLIVFDPSPLPMGLATCLLLIFTAFLVMQVRGGATAPCACFGMRVQRAPSARDLWRNAALIGALVAAAALS